MQKPIVHLNGTSRESLLEQATSASSALRAALTAIDNAAPHPRDYYVAKDPQAYNNAARQHRDRRLRLEELLREYESLAEHLADIPKAAPSVQPGDEPPRSDPYLDMQARLSAAEQETFLFRFTQMNPVWKGADVADVLSSLDSADEHLDVVEPLFEKHRDEWQKNPIAHRLATYCAIWVFGPDWATWENVKRFVEPTAP